MSIRLTKQPVSLPRPLSGTSSQSTAKPDAAARQGPSIKNALEASPTAGQAAARLRVHGAAEQIAGTADRFETAAQRGQASDRIRERLGGGSSGTTVGGQPIPESRREPWNQETYGEKIERNRDITERVFG